MTLALLPRPLTIDDKALAAVDGRRRSSAAKNIRKTTYQTKIAVDFLTQISCI